MPIGHLYAFFEEMSLQILCSFFDWLIFLLLRWVSCMYILEIKSVLVASFANIFSQSVGCLSFVYGFLC